MSRPEGTPSVLLKEYENSPKFKRKISMLLIYQIEYEQEEKLCQFQTDTAAPDVSSWSILSFSLVFIFANIFPLEPNISFGLSLQYKNFPIRLL